MRLKIGSLLAFLFFSNAAQAAYTLLVNQPSAYYQYTTSDSSISLYYAGNPAGTPTVASSFNSSAGYRFVDTNDTTTDAGLIYLDVSTTKTISAASGQSIVVVVKATGGNAIVLTGAAQTTGTPTVCGSQCLAAKDGAYYTSGTTLRISFTTTALCNAAGSGNLCTGSTVQDTSNSTLYQNLDIYFGVVTTTTGTSADAVSASSSGGDSRTGITFGITDINPTTACPSGTIDQYYFPGDSQIYLYSSNFGAGVNTGLASVSGVPLQYLLTMAKEAGTADDFQSGGLTSNSIVHYTPNTSTTEEITGFTNTTTDSGGTDHKYAVVVQSQNRAGLVSATTSKCDFYPVQSQNIRGILTESKCFIATAAYQDGRAAPVMMLRKFRDRILSKFALGRDFIKTYYHYSPAAAEWAWDKPIIRAIALKALAPIELMAWAVLKLTQAAETGTPEESYIDRVKKQIGEGEKPSSESYSEQQKKKLEAEEESPSAPNTSYIDRLKQTIAEEDKEAVKDYTIKEKSKLPPESSVESPITMVKEGRDRKLGLGETPDIKYAAGFKLGVAQGMQVTVAGGPYSFTDVYGTGFQPELMFHFERQLFHSENFGSLAIGTDLGVAYAGGNGRLEFGFNSSYQSRTGFSFFQLPLSFGATYRFNLLRVVRPYISAGGGAIFYTETRNDSKADKRGYTAIYNGSVGAALLLDFLDSSTHRDSYLASGIQHTYLYVEYMYLNSFKSSVMFKRAGFYSGFMFEF